MKKNLIKKTSIAIVALISSIALIYIAYTLTKPYTKEYFLQSKYGQQKDFYAIRQTLDENFSFIKKNPKNDSAYYSLGQGFYALKGYDDAEWALKKAIEISPNTSHYWSFLGKAYQAKKDYQNARDAYIKTIELEPDKPSNYITLAWLYYFRLDTPKDSEKDKAFEVLKKGLEKFPTDKGILFDITRYYIYDKNEKEFRKYAPRYLKVESQPYDLIKKTYELGIEKGLEKVNPNTSK